MHFSVSALIAGAAALQGYLLAVFLFAKKENRRPNRLLGLLLLLLAVTLSEWVCWWTGLIRDLPWMVAVSFGFPLLYGPVLYQYFQITFEGKWSGVRSLVHFLPFAIAVFLMLPFYLRFIPGAREGLSWIPALTRLSWFPALIFTQMIFYVFWIPYRFSMYFREQDELYKWRRLIMLAYFGIVLTYILYRIFPVIGLTAPEWKFFIAGSLIFFIYLTAWLGYIEPKIFAGLPLTAAFNPIKYRKSALSGELSRQLFQAIKFKLENERCYRDSDLNLDTLASQLGQSRHAVSQSINENAGKSFPQFVLEYRIREAIELLTATSKEDKNIIEIAYQVGFNTKESFNTGFKRYTGKTPTEYRQLHKD